MKRKKAVARATKKVRVMPKIGRRKPWNPLLGIKLGPGASHLQMVILHFEKLTGCNCNPKYMRGACRRCWTIRGARRELRKAGIRWMRGVKSDAV